MHSTHMQSLSASSPPRDGIRFHSRRRLTCATLRFTSLPPSPSLFARGKGKGKTWVWNGLSERRRGEEEAQFIDERVFNPPNPALSAAKPESAAFRCGKRSRGRACASRCPSSKSKRCYSEKHKAAYSGSSEVARVHINKADKADHLGWCAIMVAQAHKREHRACICR